MLQFVHCCQPKNIYFTMNIAFNVSTIQGKHHFIFPMNDFFSFESCSIESPQCSSQCSIIHFKIPFKSFVPTLHKYYLKLVGDFGGNQRKNIKWSMHRVTNCSETWHTPAKHIRSNQIKSTKFGV